MDFFTFKVATILTSIGLHLCINVQKIYSKKSKTKFLCTIDFILKWWPYNVSQFKISEKWEKIFYIRLKDIFRFNISFGNEDNQKVVFI